MTMMMPGVKMSFSEAYDRGKQEAIKAMEAGRLELEAIAAEEAEANKDKVPYEQKMAAMRHNLRRERLEREARTGYKDGRPIQT